MSSALICFQSDEEPPDLEDISQDEGENDRSEEHGGSEGDEEHGGSEGASEEEGTATSPSDQVFITALRETDINDDIADGGSIKEEVTLIAPTQNNTPSQGGCGLFSTTTRYEQAPPTQALLMGAASSQQPDCLPEDVSKERFRPLIEVVRSEDDCDDHEVSVTKPSMLASAPPTSHAHIVQSTTPESTELETGGQWAYTGGVTKLRPSSPPTSAGGGLLIEEIEEDDFNIGQLPLTPAEQSAIAETDAVMERIKDRPVSELSNEERVWLLAASVGSTVEEGKGVELDENTKERVRERLDKCGLIDKTSLKF